MINFMEQNKSIQPKFKKHLNLLNKLLEKKLKNLEKQIPNINQFIKEEEYILLYKNLFKKSSLHI